ncbi:MAG: GrpB family protein [Candidatus Giovannonibacteria bacterium]|nr:GrpB family protein [Candidatus Giovannonibacteria bacterium]
MNLEPYSQDWPVLYKEEAQKIREVLGDSLWDIQHIGSTAIPNIKAKPIIDIAVMLNSFDNVHIMIKKLSEIDFIYDQQKSSSERYFFVKYGINKYHLSLTIPTTSYWRRQILFRNYLIKHSEAAKEYEKLKQALLKKNIDRSTGYIDGKSDFVSKILELAENEK